MKEQGKKEGCYVGKGRDRGELRENERTGEKRMMLCGKGEEQGRTQGKGKNRGKKKDAMWERGGTGEN